MTLSKPHLRNRKSPVRKKAVGARGPRKVTFKRSRHPLDPRGSAAYREAIENAPAFADHPQRLDTLLKDALWKIKAAPREQFNESWPYLLTMIRVLRAYYVGEYREVPRERLATIISAVIYFVSPDDFIPDWLSGAGYLDDAFVVKLALESVKDDLDGFMQWEAQRM
jgi:uncharacterized membrane protein YkvA (DUF1232 family)